MDIAVGIESLFKAWSALFAFNIALIAFERYESKSSPSSLTMGK